MFLRKSIPDIKDLSLGELRYILVKNTYLIPNADRTKMLIGQIENGSCNASNVSSDDISTILMKIDDNNENFRTNFIKLFADDYLKMLIKDGMHYVELSYGIRYKLLTKMSDHFLVEKLQIADNIEHYNIGFYCGRGESYQIYKYIQDCDQWMAGDYFISGVLNKNFEPYRRAFITIQSIYHFMIINCLDIEADIKYYLKLIYSNKVY